MTNLIGTKASLAGNNTFSGNQTISGNIISTGTLQTTNINNSNSITTNSINATTGALTSLSVNVLTLLSNTPLML